MGKGWFGARCCHSWRFCSRHGACLVALLTIVQPAVPESAEAADSGEARGEGRRVVGIAPDCWAQDGYFIEQCCIAEGSQRGCWDSVFTFERCCSGVDWGPAGYNAWASSPLPPASPADAPDAGDRYDLCAEFVKRFDFSEEDALKHARYRRCLQERLALSRRSFRPALLAGQHYPTLLTPGPEGLVFALPANDFVVSKGIKLYGTYDNNELGLYKALLPVGGTMVDVGANVGAYAVPLAVHVGRDGLIVAAEPFHALFQLLTANSAINGLQNLRTRQVALGAVEERVSARGPTLERENNAGMGRVFRPFEEQHAETFMLRYDSKEEDIQVTTLDRLVAAEGLASLSVLKVDAEGHLKAVLAGGDAVLRNLRPIVVAEHSDDDALEVLERAHGYSCRELLPTHDMWVCLPDAGLWSRYMTELRSRGVIGL